MSTTVGSNGGDLTTGVTVEDSIIFIFAALAFLVASFRPTEAETKVFFFTFDLFFDDEGSTAGGPDTTSLGRQERKETLKWKPFFCGYRKFFKIAKARKSFMTSSVTALP